MNPYRCLSSGCQMSGQSDNVLYFSPSEFHRPNADIPEIKGPSCPFCNRPGNIKPLEVIHLIAQDRGLGVVYGASKFGNSDKRYMFLCGKSQKYFTSQPYNSPLYPSRFTLEPRAATCYNCLCGYGVAFDDHKRVFTNQSLLVLPS